MKDLDKQIQQALTREDAEMIGDHEDGLRVNQLMLATFKARNRYFSIIGFIYSFVFLGIGIWCVYHFYHASEIKELLAWGLSAVVSFFALGMIKVWFWVEMQRIAISRQVKRVELLSARLLQQLGSRDSSDS